MSMIRKEIKYYGTDMNLKISLGSEDGFLGYQQEIDSLTQVVSEDLINPPVDAEERRYKADPNIAPMVIEFQFYNYFTSAHTATFETAGFSSVEIGRNDPKLQNSFFILDFYDSYNILNQYKICRMYLTKVINLSGTTSYKQKPRYYIDNNNQFYYLYIPKSFINTISTQFVTGYTKFSFYNGGNKTVKSFYNSDNENLTSSLKMFFQTEIDLWNRTWKIVTPSFPNIIAKQLYNASSYDSKINAPVASIENQRQDYPNKTSFDSNDGSYF